jgi:hypothetical protein
MRRQTVTTPSFKRLSEAERSAIHAAIRALNTVATAKVGKSAGAVTPREIEAEAFKNSSSDLRESGASLYMQQWLEALARGNPSVARADVHARHDALYVQVIKGMAEALNSLILKKRLDARVHGAPREPGWIGYVGVIIGAYNADAVPQHGSVSISERGHAEILWRMRFRSALGLVAWAILTLSAIVAHELVVMRCAECGRFKIVGVRKPTRFCSPEHRNLFNVRQFRARAAKARKPK